MLAATGKPISVYKGGNFKRDYIYLEDVISAVKFLENKKVVNDSFLIGTGQPILFKDMINYIHKLTGKKSEIVEVDPPEFHKIVSSTDFVANTAKINHLGGRSRISYKQGFKKVVNAYQSKLN
jgi:nucleoside-diphosphate-sugar epimerase